MVPVCLLCLRFSCVAICSHHLEETPKGDTHSLAACQFEEECPINAAVTSALPQQSFRSSAVVGGDMSLVTPIPSVVPENNSSVNRTQPLVSASPPVERLRVLRI